MKQIEFNLIKLTVFLLIPLCFFLIAGVIDFKEIQDKVGSLTNTVREPEKVKEQFTGNADISVYFTNPEDSRTSEPLIVSALLRYLNSAKKSIYGAVYDLDYEPIADVLIQKYYQGVEVKLVVEQDNSKKECIVRCRQAGISIVEDDNPALMHDKFFVVDDTDVWTGSTNFTYNCLFRNNNNSVLIKSPYLAENYRNEFDEMFVYHFYGIKSPRNTVYREFTIDGDTTIINMFAPEDGVEQRIIKEIENTQKAICFMVFSFTSECIADSLIRAHKNGVAIKGVIEKRNAGIVASKDEYLRSAGIEDIRLDGNPNSMHHKVMIFDMDRVLTGSYNFTGGAEKRNDENVIIIKNPVIVREYLNEFQRIFEKGTPMRK